MSRGGIGREVAGARMKKRAMGASRQGQRMAPDIMTDMPMKAAAPAMPAAAAPMAAAPMAAMKKGGIAKKGNKDPSKTPSFKKGGSASKKGGLAIILMMKKGGGKKK
jgi:hypothetical protein